MNQCYNYCVEQSITLMVDSVTVSERHMILLLQRSTDLCFIIVISICFFKNVLSTIFFSVFDTREVRKRERGDRS